MKPTLTLTPKKKPTLILTPKPPPTIQKIPISTIAMKNALQNKLNPLQSNLT